MRILDIFKRKKETLTAEESWNRIWELWEIGDLLPPIENLMTYESEVNNGGHSQYFFNVANSRDLAEEVGAVLSILPEPLRENLHRAYVAFAAQEDTCEEDTDQLLENCDGVFYEHEQLVIDIIQEAANNGFGQRNSS